MSGQTSLELHKLIKHFTGNNSERTSRLFSFAIRVLSSNLQPTRANDEEYVKSLILRQVDQSKGTKEASRILELLQLLSKQKLVKEKWAILHFLLVLVGQGAMRNTAVIDPTDVSQAHSAVATRRERSLVHALTADQQLSQQEQQQEADKGGSGQRGDGGNLYAKYQKATSSHPHNDEIRRSTLSGGDRELSEAMLVKDTLLSLQGLNGKYIKYNSQAQAFAVDKAYVVSAPERELVSKLSAAGILFNRINAFLDANQYDHEFGLVGLSFCSGIREEVTEYYRFIALLESQLTSAEESGLTLRRMVVWLQSPLQRLRFLHQIISTCSGYRGGQLLSELYKFCTHGDGVMRGLARLLLDVAMPPFMDTIHNWMFNGILVDPSSEFFICCDDQIAADPLSAHDYWTQKYSLRASMVPSFISATMAREVLLGGKAINFIRTICGNMDDIMSGIELTSPLKDMHWTEDAIQRGELPGATMVTKAYNLASKTLLRIMTEDFKLPVHFQAMRKYLLLGQGDMVLQLMDNLKRELDFPADNLLRHNLTGILDGALRGSNARFDDPDVLQRLDVKLLEPSLHEKGWDIFSLSYATDGPISSVFSPTHVFTYLKVFKFLWRVKRVEFVLSAVWSQQTITQRSLKSIEELQSIFHRLNLLGAEMVHFIRQVQHYLLFEVLETQWQQFLQAYDNASDLDAILTAHDSFLATLVAQLFLSEAQDAQDKLSQLRSIFDQVFKFQELHKSVNSIGLDELDKRHRGAFRLHASSARGVWDRPDVDADLNGSIDVASSEEFHAKLTKAENTLSIVTVTFQNMVTKFLGLLSRVGDENTKSLRSRIDFNAHYSTQLLKKRLSTTPAPVATVHSTRLSTGSQAPQAPQGSRHLPSRTSVHVNTNTYDHNRGINNNDSNDDNDDNDDDDNVS